MKIYFLLTNIGKSFAKPQVIKRPNSNSTVYGSTVTLECSLSSSYNDYEMIWFKVKSNGKFLRLRSRTRSVWSSDYNKKVQKEVLKITNYTKENERYFCQVKRYVVNHVGRTFVKLRLQGKLHNLQTWLVDEYNYHGCCLKVDVASTFLGARGVEGSGLIYERKS